MTSVRDRCLIDGLRLAAGIVPFRKGDRKRRGFLRQFAIASAIFPAGEPRDVGKWKTKEPIVKEQVTVAA